MVDFAAGVEDSNNGALTGVVESPCFNSADLGGGVEEVGAFPFHINECTNTVELVDLVDEAIFAFECETVEHNGVVVLNNDFGAELFVDHSGCGLVGSVELLTIIACCFEIFANLRCGSGFEFDQNGNDILGIALFLDCNVRSHIDAAVPDAGNINGSGFAGLKGAVKGGHLIR